MIELIILAAIQVVCWSSICIYRSCMFKKINQSDIYINLPKYEEEPLPIYKRYENGSNPPEYTLPSVQQGTLPSVQHIIII